MKHVELCTYTAAVEMGSKVKHELIYCSRMHRRFIKPLPFQNSSLIAEKNIDDRFADLSVAAYIGLQRGRIRRLINSIGSVDTTNSNGDALLHIVCQAGTMTPN
jgi:hypothetical protein